MRTHSRNRRSALRTLAVIVALGCVSFARQDAKPAIESRISVEDVSALLEPVRAKDDLPALAGAIIVGKDVVALGAVGVRAAGSSAKVTIDDQWHLGSCTKAMTATLVAKFVERGKLKWSTTIAEALPDLKDKMNEQWRDVPIEWLLEHRGGACGSPPSAMWSALWQRTGTPHETRRWFVEQLLAAAPEAKPGTKFIYSNQGYTIAGAMLEQITGKTWEELMQSELFTPLGMTSAGFGAPGTKDALDQPLGHNPKPVQLGPGSDNPPAIGPAGTVHCSIGDWAKFVAVHLRGEEGDDSLLKTDTFRKLHECPPGQTYAMGWGRDARKWAGGDTLHHAGSNTMWYCVAWVAPAKNCAVLITTNIAGDVASKACDEAVQVLLRKQKLLE
jgi:CubicO group peptidase (beta-lactamase class C family)